MEKQIQDSSLASKDVACSAEIIKNRFYFVTFKSKKNWHNTKDVHFFCTDEEFVYQNFFSDFGPLNLASLYRYYIKMKSKLDCAAFKNKKIVHCTTMNRSKRVNAALLVGCFSIIYLKIPPHTVYKTLLSKYPYDNFQDASVGVSMYQISLLDCLTAIHKACLHNLVNFEDFEVQEFEKYDQIQNGDMNWIVPQKMLAFSGPTKSVNSFYHRPEFFIEYFQKNNIRTVVRLNRNVYDSRKFTNAGVAHHDLYFVDGSAPAQSIMYQFLDISEKTPYGIAVHCKAGLGRTGTLIGAYLIKHYQMTAVEAIAWLRICRPGSVIGHQQAWLEEMESILWKLGDAFRIMNYGGRARIPHHKFGIYSVILRKLVEKGNQKAISRPTSVGNLLECRSDSLSSCGIIGKQQEIIGENSRIREFKTKKPELSKFSEVAPSPKWLLDYSDLYRGTMIKPPFFNPIAGVKNTVTSPRKNQESQGDQLLAIKDQRANHSSGYFLKNEKTKTK